ncbi:hypothetical protein CBM2586_A120193 [Cupriavidus phytorum]|uniref:Uncharacterized protein n=1 Tax=Cupriavidus taiwanensis TaxID=164546 RepID=A0A375C1Y2_9BURK|nr:hypothetical protein CBM2586_A120193 [Cupriavidus taiwanensis]
MLDPMMVAPHRSKLAAGCSGYPISAGKSGFGQRKARVARVDPL